MSRSPCARAARRGRGRGRGRGRRTRRRGDGGREPVDGGHPSPRPRPSPQRGGARTRRAGSRRSRLRSALIGRRSIARSSGSWPQTQTGKSGGHVQPRSFVAQELLDDPVLERVERDHREPAARAGASRARRAAPPRASRARRSPRSAAPGRRASPDGPRRSARAPGSRLDRVDELAGPLERLLLAGGGRSPARSASRSALRRSGGRSSRARARATRSRSRARSSSCDRVHAHVERRVDRVREAALGPVELHRRDAEVEQDRVGADAVRRRAAASTTPKSPRRSRACTPARFSKRSKYVRAVGSRSIAISLPRPCRSAASSAAWPPAPKVASTTVSPGLHARGARAPRSRGRGRDQSRWAARRSATSSALPSTSASSRRQAARSQISRWSWTPATTTSRPSFACSSSAAGNADAALLVELRLRRAGEEEALHPAALLAQRVERREPRLDERVPVGARVGEEAAVHAARHDDPLPEGRAGSGPAA